MKKILVGLIGTIVALLAVLAVCLLHFKSPDQMMVPPNQFGENAEIVNAFETGVGDSTTVTLQHPYEGDYKSAYIKHDIDGDGEDEVLAFYTKKDSDTTVHLHVMDYVEDSWTNSYDAPGYGSEINSVSFEDFNQDGIDEIILGWNLYGNSNTKVLTVHEASLKAGKLDSLKPLVNQPYAYMNVLDMDQDGSKEILLVWDDTTNPPSKTYAELLKMTDKGAIKAVGKQINLDSNVSAYSNLFVQKTGNEPIIFLDAYKGDNAMVTEIIWWDKEKETLVSPLVNQSALTNKMTLRSPAIPCMDIDDDGNIEIPITQNSTLAKSGTTSEVVDNDVSVDSRVYLTFWSSFTNKTSRSPAPKLSGFVDSNNSFMLKVNSKQAEGLLAYTNEDTGVMTIYSTNDGKTVENELFSLVSSSNGSTPDVDDSYSSLIANDKWTVYVSLTSAGKDAGYTLDSIEKNMIFLDE